jgi:uncharacterized membrane protein
MNQYPDTRIPGWSRDRVIGSGDDRTRSDVKNTAEGPRWLVAAAAATATLVVLDLGFLGVVAKDFYDAQLGSLRRSDPFIPAALAFYVMYLAAIVLLVAAPAPGPRAAALRGAVLGALCYGTYELTNWAVIAGWPAPLVAVDLAWGIALTAVTSAVARVALGPVRNP